MIGEGCGGGRAGTRTGTHRGRLNAVGRRGRNGIAGSNRPDRRRVSPDRRRRRIPGRRRPRRGCGYMRNDSGGRIGYGHGRSSAQRRRRRGVEQRSPRLAPSSFRWPRMRRRHVETPFRLVLPLPHLVLTSPRLAPTWTRSPRARPPRVETPFRLVQPLLRWLRAPPRQVRNLLLRWLPASSC